MGRGRAAGRGACSCACAMPEPDPAQGQQVIIGVDVDQHRLMPYIAQKLGPAMYLRADLVRDRLTIQLPRAAGLRRVREVLQRRAEGLGFLSEDPVSDQHQFGQRDPGGRACGNSFMIGDTWRLLNTAVYAFSQDATQQPQRYEHPQELLSTLILPELIEAAVRSGHTARAADALEPLAETTRAAATEWALGTEARSRALLGRESGRGGSLSRARRSTASDAPAWASRSPAPACSTVNGCAAIDAGVRPAISFAPDTRSSSQPAPGRLPNGPGPSSARLASAHPNAPRRPEML